MTISYNWISEYLPEKIEPEKLSKILTSIGLEVESMETYQEIKGGLKGLVIGEIVDCEKHPDADKLSITKVNIGTNELLQIVCGASNVAKEQKVIVATIGTTIYPIHGDSLTMKKAKIRGVESFGMICAEDEIGLNDNHAGILVLPNDAKIGEWAVNYFNISNDIIFEIGLTPNRMDAMSHLGVAQDVCAYLSHHNNKETKVKLPYKNNFKADNQNLIIDVKIENNIDCQRYAGVSIQNVIIADSPKWLQQKLKSIGLRPINNIVDITNFILHETGQPLHAFDANTILDNKIVVKNIEEDFIFKTLDEKERKLSANDLMICNGKQPMCIAGVFGGLHSGVTTNTKNIFLESAWFNPNSIRKTSLKHNLRTDAATRFEKGVDISNTVNVLKRAALLIKEIAGGQISSNVIDVYPNPKEKTAIALKYHYLKKLSGKNYHGDSIKNILTSLGFEMIKEGLDELWVKVPYSKPDITIGADLVEEIMRIDGLDNVEIPKMITIAPAVETIEYEANYKEKIANFLIGQGFNEIFTNSITNAKYYDEKTLEISVKMINNLSEDLNIMRPSMLETGLESIAHNINRKNNNLQFFEFGKTYATNGKMQYIEKNHLSLFITGNKIEADWKNKAQKTDYYFIKGLLQNIITLCGLTISEIIASTYLKLDNAIAIKINNEIVAIVGSIDKQTAINFDCKQPVYFADIDWDKILQLSKKSKINFKEIPKYPAVQRDLSIVVNKNIYYQQIEKLTHSLKLSKLKSLHLFDIFESEKLGVDKKSMAINYTFIDEQKTMTDAEIDTMMNKIINNYETELLAEIRK